MWHDLRNLLEMYISGGLVVMTDMEGNVLETAVSPPAAYTGKIYDRQGIRTTIQFDSDYVTVLSPAVLRKTAVLQSHVTRVQTQLAVLERLRVWARRSWLLFLLLPLAWYAAELRSLATLAEAWRLLLPTLLSAAIILARKQLLRFLRAVLLPLIMRVAAWFVTRKFNEFISQPL
jgi:hypothetical protein